MKIVSINIEDKKHLERVVSFLAREDAIVVCLMEVREQDVLILAGDKYPYVVYAANSLLSGTSEKTGVAILSKKMIFEVEKYYCGEKASEYITSPGNGTHAPVVLLAKIVSEEGECQIGAVHFSWTPDGHENPRQEDHLKKLLKYLEKQGEFVLCGDFNIPRGYKLYQSLADKYQDNIPVAIASTIDPSLHRANFAQHGKLALVVDYVWSTPKYRVSQVRIEDGISDHCGVVCVVDAPARTVLAG